MKYIFYLFSLFGLILILSSCQKETVNEPTSNEKILPLEIGNKWNYSRVWAGSENTVTDTFNIEMSITKLDTVKSFIGYRLTGFVLWSWKATFCNYKNDGLYIAIDPDDGGPVWDPPAPPQPLITGKGLSYPTYIGDTWQYDKYIIRTMNLSQSISVPAGTFECINYQIFIEDSLSAEIWATPNIGIVKATQKIGSSIQVNSLKSYKLN